MAPDFDVIHETSVFLYQSFLARRLAQKFKKPLIISPRGSLMKGTLGLKGTFKKKVYISLIERKNLEAASLIHFTAEVEREEYLSNGFPKKNSLVIPNILGLEVPTPSVSFRKKFGIAAEKKIILSVGRLNWKKGFDTLILAFSNLLKEKPDTVLAIAGEDDGYKAEIEKLIKDKGIEESVILTGLLQGDLKEAAYRECDVFELPSYSENFGMAVAEAMRAERPVIVTQGVALSKDIKEMGAGIVSEKDPVAILGATIQILNNPQKAGEMGKIGGALVRDRFSPHAVAEAMRSAYNNSVTLP
jgi:glycosyltransferase involved in cell wall biosynthesis